MNSILIIYKGWKIKKFDKGFAAVFYTDGREILLSGFRKKLEDVFFFCDSIDFMIENNKIERGCNT